MNGAQIEGMIDRICGLYPASTIALKKVKDAWVADDFLLYQSVEDARKVITIIMDNHDKFPSLKDVHKAFRLLRKPAVEQTKIVCEICDGNGWDTGRRWNFQTKEMICDKFTKESMGQTYTYVVPCKCREYKAA